MGSDVLQQNNRSKKTLRIFYHILLDTFVLVSMSDNEAILRRQ